MIYGKPEMRVQDMRENGHFDYGLFYVFDSHGIVENEVLDECYREIYERSAKLSPCFGPFDSQDELTRFAFNLCEKRDVEQSILLSQEEYNQVLEETHTKEELLLGLASVGRPVENLEGPRKGLFGKIFNS
jgi:hypothetical protein